MRNRSGWTVAAVTASACALSACQTSPPPAGPPQAASDHADVQAIEGTNFRQVPCGQALDNKDLFDAVMIWVDGYAHGRAGRPLTTQHELIAHKDAFFAQCERDRSATVMAVVLAMNRPARRAVTPAAAPGGTPGGAPAAAPSGAAPATRARTPPPTR